MNSYRELKELRWGHHEKLQAYMRRDLSWRSVPDNDEQTIARLKKVEDPVSDKDGYSLGTWFKPPVPKDSDERQLTLASRKEILETCKWASSLWEVHPEHKALGEPFKALSTDLGTTKINKLVCIGLGSLSQAPFHTLEELREAHEEAQEMEENYYWGLWHIRPYFQHLAAQTIAQILKDQNDGKPLDLYAQDIGYRENDIKVLEDNVDKFGNNDGKGNFAVLDGSPSPHEGFLKIDPETFVLTVQPTIPLRQMVCETSTPAAIMCIEIKDRKEEDKKEAEVQSTGSGTQRRRKTQTIYGPSSTWTTLVFSPPRHFSPPFAIFTLPES